MKSIKAKKKISADLIASELLLSINFDLLAAEFFDATIQNNFDIIDDYLAITKSE